MRWASPARSRTGSSSWTRDASSKTRARTSSSARRAPNARRCFCPRFCTTKRNPRSNSRYKGARRHGPRVESRASGRERRMKNGKPFPIPVRVSVRVSYSCAKCPAYCCSYPEIEITPRDIERLAKRFDLGYREAEERFTKLDGKERVRLLRHKKDSVFATVCMFLDQKK